MLHICLVVNHARLQKIAWLFPCLNDTSSNRVFAGSQAKAMFVSAITSLCIAHEQGRHRIFRI